MQKLWQPDKKQGSHDTPKSHVFFRKHLPTSPHEHPNERIDDATPSLFSIDFIYRYDKNLIFPLWKYKICLITTHNKWEIMFTLIYFDMGILFYQYELKIKKFRNFIYNTYEKLWGHDIINPLTWTLIRTGQEMLPEKVWNPKMSQPPHLPSDSHHLCTNLWGKPYSFPSNSGNSGLDFPFNEQHQLVFRALARISELDVQTQWTLRVNWSSNSLSSYWINMYNKYGY